MSKNKTYFITYEIKTNYDIKELEEVIDKVFDIPALQYEDCECFEYQKKLITSISKVAERTNESLKLKPL